MAYIYKITNIINKKMYIGKTTHINPRRRWSEHQAEAKNSNHNHRALYKAINKYGAENFVFEIIEETNNPEEREMYYIQFYDTFHNGYNETLGGEGTKYLELPEQEICKMYLQYHSMRKVASSFGHDELTIKKILYKNNIPILNAAEVSKHTKSKAVAKIDTKTGEIIKIYPSVASAEQDNGNSRHIAQVCNGKRKTAMGYCWKYVENIID